MPGSSSGPTARSTEPLPGEGQALSALCSACLLQRSLAVIRRVRGRRATYSFPADYLSGAEPLAEVTFDTEGNLYGTTDVGGPNYCRGPNACGVLFKMTTPIQEWNQSVIWDFEQSSGSSPYGGMTFDASGNIFGVTTGGGSGDFGTFYEMAESAGSWTHSVLYNFTGQSDGAAPDGNLIEDAQGNFYGTAATGGSGGGGTVFEFSPSGSAWNLTVLYSFTGSEGPVGRLTMDANGSLYGTTFSDGAFGFGNVFKLTKSNGSWNYASLHDFSGGADGRNSYAPVQIDAAGNIYGTAALGGRREPAWFGRLRRSVIQ